MRIESVVTSISWIPTEAMSGPLRIPVDVGMGHYDAPPPDRLEDLAALRDADRFRFANELRAFVETDGGRIVDAGYLGGGQIGSTTLNFGVRSVTIPAVAYPDIQLPPVVTGDSVRFEQTAGGRTGAPMPRRISRPPYVQITAPTAWTTLALTIGADGSVSFEVVGASPFPRHWFYDADGALVKKSGLIDFSAWAAQNTEDRSPWGDHQQELIVVDVESAAERTLSVEMMDGRPGLRRFKRGETLMRQGTTGSEVMLVLDGMAEVTIDDEPVAEVGPGSILGEMAALEQGVRTATVVALTPVRVAVTAATDLDPAALRDIADLRRREDG